MDNASFWTLREAPLHRFTPEEWADWYPRMEAWLDNPDPAVRDAALERLMMGVFRAERPPREGDRRGAALEERRRRAAWLLDLVTRAQEKHPDLLPAFLRALRWHGDDEPFPEVLLPWLRDLRARRFPGVPDDLAEGAMVLVGGLPRVGRPDLPPLLDHPSDYVRGCAACVFGRGGSGWGEEGRDFPDAGLLAALTAKELARPGIVGPFWSGLGFFGDEPTGLDPLAWMLDIIERRSGPEPADMPFNGVDFHVHELAAGRPEAVRRLARAGHTDLALMTATEIRGIVEGMAPVLRELAAHPDADVAREAAVHLARYYGEASPGADPDRLRHLPGWRAGVNAFVIRYGDTRGWSDMAVFFPKDRAAFGDDEAWTIVDAALPPELRGDAVRHQFAEDEDGVGPVRFGGDEARRYASDAAVTLSGDPDTRSWTRIEVSGGRLRDRWQPFTWTAPAGGR